MLGQVTSASRSDDARTRRTTRESGRPGPDGPDEAGPIHTGSTATVALHRTAPRDSPVDPPRRVAGPAGSRTVSSPADNATVPWHRVPTGSLVAVDGPVGHRWRKVFGRTLSKAWSDSLFGMSSQAAFWSALSTAPLLLALLGSVGFVANWFGPNTISKVHEQINIFLGGVFNKEVAQNLVGDTVNTILNNGQADVVSVGFLISLWAGSSAMSAFIESITIAYGQHEVRHPVAERFFALGLYLAALVSGVFLLPVLAIGPEALPKVFPRGWQDHVTSIVRIAYYPFLVLGLVLLLTTLYKLAPKHRHAWKRGVPGAMLAALVFLVTSFGLRLYLAYVYSHGLTYGALAIPITFLLFYYFVAMAIIIGAQFNNALLEFYPPRRPRHEIRRWQRYDPERDAGGDADRRG